MDLFLQIQTGYQKFTTKMENAFHFKVALRHTTSLHNLKFPRTVIFTLTSHALWNDCGEYIWSANRII